jgi:hypothetical protein
MPKFSRFAGKNREKIAAGPKIDPAHFQSSIPFQLLTTYFPMRPNREFSRA